MAWLAFAVLSGASGIGGLLLLAVGGLLRLAPPSGLPRRGGRTALASGLALVLTSTIAPPGGLAVALAASTALALLLPPSRRAGLAGAALAALSLALAASEAQLTLPPRIHLARDDRLAVIGDSLAAGVAATDAGTWPRGLERGLATPVLNLAHAGATAKSALTQAARLPPGPAVVLIEIGGNDLLGGGSAVVFERDLDRLLRAVSGPQRRIVLLELPVPPLHARWLRAQRGAAARHGCELVPHWILAEAILQPGSQDGLHLSPAGHARLAQRLAQVLRPL